jgi:hypothetical protein
MDLFIDKQPYEEFYIGFDFINVMAGTDEISSATVTAVDELGVDSTAIIITTIKQYLDPTKVYVWVKGGTHNKTYTITCKIVTDIGEKYEKEGEMSVVEV